MDLLDPKNDAVFKYMLAGDDTEDLRISLLTAILRPESPIVTATVKNPHLPKKHIRDKDTVLDILMELSDGRLVDLEMQMAWRSYIPERAYYYGSRVINAQLSRGQRYQSLKPVSTIFLLNAIGFPEAPADHGHYVFSMKEQSNLAQLPPLFTMHFVEIPKIIRNLPAVLHSQEDLALALWCQFLYSPHQLGLAGLDEVIATMPALKKAKKKLEEISADEEKREIARMRERGRRDYESDLEYALTRGRAEGIAEGEARGRAEGIAEGIAEGERNAKITLLHGLLGNVATSGLSSKELATLCGLSVDEVDKLRATGH
ncbi:MAG: Rpn family recombination-promoting nuclease/putative transposase [Deltaproteobacteria bacterium]|nr:Rpn family recombination-promoting nuclease/putative transposase [Deltaproteobacteria bacterium]